MTVKRKRASQLETAQTIMRGSLKRHFGEQPGYYGLIAVEQYLNDLLNESQNAPPHGEADGSIDQERYRILRFTYNTIRELKQALDEWEKLV